MPLDNPVPPTDQPATEAPSPTGIQGPPMNSQSSEPTNMQLDNPEHPPTNQLINKASLPTGVQGLPVDSKSSEPMNMQLDNLGHPSTNQPISETVSPCGLRDLLADPQSINMQLDNPPTNQQSINDGQPISETPPPVSPRGLRDLLADPQSNMQLDNSPTSQQLINDGIPSSASPNLPSDPQSDGHPTNTHLNNLPTNQQPKDGVLPLTSGQYPPAAPQSSERPTNPSTEDGLEGPPQRKSFDFSFPSGRRRRASFTDPSASASKRQRVSSVPQTEPPTDISPHVVLRMLEERDRWTREALLAELRNIMSGIHTSSTEPVSTQLTENMLFTIVQPLLMTTTRKHTPLYFY
jgi:hypothetical protein